MRARRDDDDTECVVKKRNNIHLGDDGRLLGRLGRRLGRDDGGEGELGRERRGEHRSSLFVGRSAAIGRIARTNEGVVSSFESVPFGGEICVWVNCMDGWKLEMESFDF